MFNFHKLTDENEKSKAYNNLRDIVRKDFPTAEIRPEENGFCVVWCGVAIGDKCETAFDAWLDVALPY